MKDCSTSPDKMVPAQTMPDGGGAPPLLETARAYWEAGLTPMPRVPGDANPHFITTAGEVRAIGWGSYKQKQPAWSTVERWFRLGSLATVGVTLLTGSHAMPRSADAACLQILDIETEELFEAFMEEVRFLGHADILHRCVIERTAGDGGHIGFLCATISDKQKLPLARRSDQKILFELLQHQPCTVAPTQIRCKDEHADGACYTLLNGTWAHPQEISGAQRQTLLDIARRYTEVPEKVAADPFEHTTGTRPGDLLNERADLDWWQGLLTRHGWRDVSRPGWARRGVYYFQRPGKGGHNVSATYGKTGPALYVFSSNASPFEAETAYKPFAAYTLLEHGGDYKAAAHALATLYDLGAPQTAHPSRDGTHTGVGGEGLSSLNSLSSQRGENAQPPVFASEDELNSLFSLNSQPFVNLREEAFHGIAGELVRLIEPHTEADLAALLIQFLVYFGAMVGRHPYSLVGATRHYPNLFAVLVGATSKGRKGSAYDYIEAVMSSLESSWSLDNTIRGCGSGEGLIHAVRDPVIKREPVKVKGEVKGYQEVVTDAGVTDKRLLVHEPEFASVLKIAQREGNILSMTLRQAWDGGPLHNTVKTAPQRATNAHIALLGHITADEVTKLLSTTEAANGFGNRFLWVTVKRSKLLPEGGDFSRLNMQDITAALRNALQHAQRVNQMHRDDDAKRAWAAVYETLSTPPGGLAGNLLARGEAYVLRLSMLYALLDCSATVRVEHLTAALAVWEYVEASAALVFGATTGNPEADALREALKWADKGMMARTEIIREVFHGHIKAHELNTAIRLLLKEGIVTRQFAPSRGGRRKEFICYGGDTTAPFLSRNPKIYIDLIQPFVPANGTMRMVKSCEFSEKSEESLSPPVETLNLRNGPLCEESEKSEESPLAPPPASAVHPHEGVTLQLDAPDALDDLMQGLAMDEEPPCLHVRVHPDMTCKDCGVALYRRSRPGTERS